jgi:purine-nucleoside phosphorylase
LLLSNAAGGLNTDYRRGDMMLLADHINLQGSNPLVGPNVDDWGPRFPDMSDPYDRELRGHAARIAATEGIALHEGVYVAISGPNLETPAEYRFLRRIGGDAVGMSTVPEVIVARHMGVRCMAISVITDECDPDNLAPVALDEIIAAAGAAEPALGRLMKGVVKEVGDRG